MALVGAAVQMELRNRVAWNSVLEIDMSGTIEEQRTVSDASVMPTGFVNDGITISELTRAIDAAREDRRVSGLVLRIGELEASGGKLDEVAAQIATHLAAFRKSGKATVCLFADEDDDNRGNAIAAACDQRISESLNTDEDVVDFFDNKFGEDNWFPIEVSDYLNRARGGS